MILLLYNPLNKRMIENSQTIGEKILNKRIELGLLQSDVAKAIGVCKESITNWENNRSPPQIQAYPRLIEFLGYFPLGLDNSTLSGKIKKYRYLKGLSQEDLARKLGVNESTIYHYENEKHKPFSKILQKINKIVNK